MSSSFKSTVIRVGLLGLGLAAWAGAGKSLHEREAFKFTPNVFSLKGSPFGRTLAMAMQGPADVYFHQGEGHDHSSGHKHAPGEGCATCDEAAATQQSVEDAITAATDERVGTESGMVTDQDQLLVTTGGSNDGHDHAPGESCTSCDHDAETPAVVALEEGGFRTTILDKIRDWRGVKNSRTNPHSNSAAHKFFIRSEVEKKLFLTYQMDPTNYGGYGAYFLFLSESSLGTHGDRSRAQARRLAEATVAWCVREWDNPNALLTAAAASHDMVQFLIGENSPEAARLAHEYASLTGQSLEQFDQVSLQMLFDGTWDRFSPARQDEMSQRADLLRKLHDADRQTIGAHVSAPSKPEGQPAG